MADPNDRRAGQDSWFASLLGRLAPVEPRETSDVAAAFFLFFFVMAGYFMVRPVRDTIGTLIPRDKLADVWVITWIVSLLVIPLYGFIVARVRRSIFLPGIYGFVALILVVLAFEMR